ncbi:hypothetical protein BDF21DRAFT_417289 [Thamnidium elegans]|nr:hypothetical protein BDF21DRAFT_417289 [Thamnidium elegans]
MLCNSCHSVHGWIKVSLQTPHTLDNKNDKKFPPLIHIRGRGLCIIYTMYSFFLYIYKEGGYIERDGKKKEIIVCKKLFYSILTADVRNQSIIIDKQKSFIYVLVSLLINFVAV